MKRTGYKVVRATFDKSTGKASGEYEDFVTGFVTPDGKVWGSPGRNHRRERRQPAYQRRRRQDHLASELQQVRRQGGTRCPQRVAKRYATLPSDICAFGEAFAIVLRTSRST